MTILTHKEDSSPAAGDFMLVERATGNRVLPLRTTVGARPVTATAGSTQMLSAWMADVEAVGLVTPPTAGVVTASKFVVVDANKDIGDFRNLDAVNFDAGVSGTAGTVDIFPTTAAKGKVSFDVTDQTGNTTVTNRFGAMGQATVLTVPDPGAATANYVLSEGTQTIAGAKTFSGNNTLTGSIQNTNTTAVTADGSPGPTLTFTDGLNLVSFTTDANDTVSLPTNVAGDVGKEIEIYAVQGFELISADASATLNNVVIGATNECAFVAGTYAKLKCVADNTWLAVISTLIDGTQTKLVPDALA